MSPRDIAGRLWYIADYALQLYCATCFVELVTSRGTMLIDYFHLGHCNRNLFNRGNVCMRVHFDGEAI